MFNYNYISKENMEEKFKRYYFIQKRLTLITLQRKKLKIIILYKNV